MHKIPETVKYLYEIKV